MKQVISLILFILSVAVNHAQGQTRTSANNCLGNYLSITGTQTPTNKTISGATNTITNVSLTSGVTGTLPVANGGTNVSSLTGQAGKYLQVNVGETGYQFATGGSGQSNIQFKDEGVNQGTSGGVTIVDFTGAGVSASESAGTLTVNIAGGGAGALDDLSDVVITAGASGEFLRHNGTNWVDATIQAGDIPDLSATYQPLDPDLTTIAGLTATTDNFLVSVSSAWASRTPTQVKTTLGATTVGNNFFTLTNPSAITFPRMNADNTVTSRTAAELKTDLSLNNVENTALSTWAGSANITTVGTLSSGSLPASLFTGDIATARLTNIKQVKAAPITAPTASENTTLFYTTQAITIEEVRGVLIGTTPSVTFVLNYGDTRDAADGQVVSSIQFDSGETGYLTTGFAFTIATSSIPANNYIWITTSATGGTVNELHLNLTYRQ